MDELTVLYVVGAVITIIGAAMAIWRWGDRVIKAIVRWLGRLRAARVSLQLEIGEVSYQGTHPYKDEFNVSNVICQVSVRNPSPAVDTVAMFRLEVDSHLPRYKAEVKKTDHGDILIPAGGGFSSVPAKPNWLVLPLTLGPYEAAWGWIGFVFLEPPDYLTFEEARRLRGNLTAIPARGGPVSAAFPPCRMPDLSQQ